VSLSVSMCPKMSGHRSRSNLVRQPGRHSDGGGLYFRVLNDAKAYFVYRYTVSGKERETSLGPFPELGLAEARIKHAELRKMVRVDRVDPIAEKRAAKTVQPSVKPTFGAMADEFIAAHEPSWKNRKHVWQWKQTLGQYAGPIRDIPVDEIKTADVLAVLQPLWTRTPETGSRLRGRVEAVIDMARALGHIDADRANPARWKGHLDHLLPPAKKLGVRGPHAALPYAAHGDQHRRVTGADIHHFDLGPLRFCTRRGTKSSSPTRSGGFQPAG
jgi:hypothetical protein